MWKFRNLQSKFYFDKICEFRFVDQKAGNQNLKVMILFSLTWKVNAIILWLLYLWVEPIEQNVNGKNGIYELVYFVKDSKTLKRFKV